jgi:hypothetical protein
MLRISEHRWLAEARTLGEEMTLLHTTCEVVTRETPYAAWRDLLGQLLSVEWDDPEARVLDLVQDQIRPAIRACSRGCR